METKFDTLSRAFKIANPALPAAFTRSRAEPFAVTLTDAVAALDLSATGSALKVVLKQVGKYDSDPLASLTLTAANADADVANRFAGVFDLINANVNAALFVDSNLTNDLAKVDCLLEIAHRANGSAPFVPCLEKLAVSLVASVGREEDQTPATLPTPDDFVAARAVLFDRAQTLTTDQKLQARTNIGAGTGGGGGAPSGPAGGDLTGTYPNPTLANPITKDARNQAYAPTVNADSTQGYSVGSRWYMNDGAASTYYCTDATPTAAVWVLVAGGTTPGLPDVIAVNSDAVGMTAYASGITPGYCAVFNNADALHFFDDAGRANLANWADHAVLASVAYQANLADSLTTPTDSIPGDGTASFASGNILFGSNGNITTVEVVYADGFVSGGVSSLNTIIVTNLLTLGSFTLATLPAIVLGAVIYVSDATNGSGSAGIGSLCVACYDNATLVSVWMDVTTNAPVA